MSAANPDDRPELSPSAAEQARLPWQALVGLGALGLVVRLVYLWVLAREELVFGLHLDAAHFARVASSIREGMGAGEGPYLLSPLYPYYLALFEGVDSASAPLWGARIVQAFVGAGTVMLCALLAGRLAGAGLGRRAALLAGVLCALFGPLIHLDAAILVASWQAFFVTLAVVLAMAGVRPGWAVGSGLALGLSAALRPTGLVLLPVLLVTRRYGAKGAAALVLGTLVCVLPFTLRNLAVSGETVLLSANGGFNFWVGNHEDANGLFDPPPGYDFERDPTGVELARRQLGADASHGEASAWWRERASFDVGLFATKLALLFHPVEIPQLGWSHGWYAERAWPLRLPLDSSWVLLCAFAAPFALRLGRARAASLLTPVCVLSFYLVAIALFFVTARYRGPVLPLALALGAAGGVHWWRALWSNESRTRAFLLAGIVIALALGSRLLLFQGPLAVAPYAGREESFQAMHLMEQGRVTEALEVFPRALELGESSQTRAAYAEALRTARRSEEAARQYEALLERDPGNGLAWFNLGNLRWEDLHDAEGASGAFTRALELLPEFADVWFNRAAVHLGTGRWEAAESNLVQALELAPIDVPWRSDAERGLAVARERRAPR